MVGAVEEVEGDPFRPAVRLAAEGLRAVAGKDFLLASSTADSYGRLFGRDSLITSLQFLSAVRLDPSLAPLLLPPVERSLRALASLQGVIVDPWTEEEPGKILHEWSPGAEGDFPGAYYASIDSTPLFLVTIHEYDAVCGMLQGDRTARRWETGTEGRSPLLLELSEARDRALQWLLNRADLDGDGFLQFIQKNPEHRSLINQNWKDSRDSILRADGSTPAYPVAYAEVQGYCYRALCLESAARQETDPARSAELLVRADRLARAFERRFWMPEASCYAQGLDAGKAQLGDVASNAFHWLWMGPVRPRRFRSVASRLLAADMMTPFGLRTLSAASPNYAPLRYHRGSIWPWDNWVTATALRRLRMDRQAESVDRAILKAVLLLGCPAEMYAYRDGDALPAVQFQDFWGRRTLACRVQAWTVGYLIEMLARHGLGGELVAAAAALRPTIEERAIP